MHADTHRFLIFDYGHTYGHIPPMKTVSKGKLKAKMLEYFRQVEATGEPLIVTDHGRKVLQIRPLAGKATNDQALAELRALATPTAAVDDEELLKPLPLEDWEAEREDDRNPW
jgi:antitoxin (DNA-binding transcriptional repressor) of toxin-antitoxin stability system